MRTICKCSADEFKNNNEPSTTHVLPCSTLYLIALLSQPKSTMDILSIMLDFVEYVGIDAQCAMTKEEIKGYLKSELENSRYESFFLYIIVLI